MSLHPGWQIHSEKAQLIHKRTMLVKASYVFDVFLFSALTRYVAAVRPGGLSDINTIMCFGPSVNNPWPPMSGIGWPTGRNPHSYISAQQLCSATSGLPNLGCSCESVSTLFFSSFHNKSQIPLTSPSGAPATFPGATKPSRIAVCGMRDSTPPWQEAGPRSRTGVRTNAGAGLKLSRGSSKAGKQPSNEILPKTTQIPSWARFNRLRCRSAST